MYLYYVTFSLSQFLTIEGWACNQVWYFEDLELGHIVWVCYFTIFFKLTNIVCNYHNLISLSLASLCWLVMMVDGYESEQYILYFAPISLSTFTAGHCLATKA